MADEYVGRSRLRAGEGAADQLFRYLAEADLEARCIDVMLGRQEEARNATEANLFRLVCDHVLGSTAGAPKDRLAAAASRYFGAHPDAEWSIEQIVLREWPASIARIQRAILLAAEEGAGRPHVIETSFTESEVTRVRAMAAKFEVSVEDLVRQAVLTFSRPIDEINEAVEIIQRLKASTDRQVPAIEPALSRLVDRAAAIAKRGQKRDFPAS